jgi:MoxR-like ATPase
MASPTLRAARATPTAHTALIEPVIEALNRIIIGKTRHLRLGVACLLARGHLLIEDVPGVGKTTLAHALAKALGLSYQRIQFTSDLLPADILGVSVFHRDNSRFEFHKGPVFSQLVLADEINRATPKAQSALLEAMEERQVTADGTTYALPSPFFVIATRNPAHQIGTFPLPESQLDRFLMQIELGYPAPSEERQLLANGERRVLVEQLQPVLSLEALLRLQDQVAQVHVSEALLDYVQALIAYTRDSGEFAAGLSPRAGIALVRAAQAWALMAGHGGIHPEDIQAVFGSIAAHRLQSAHGRSLESDRDVGAAVLANVPVP